MDTDLMLDAIGVGVGKRLYRFIHRTETTT